MTDLTREEVCVLLMRRRGISQSDMSQLVTVPGREVTHRLISEVLKANQPADLMLDSMSGRVRRELLTEIESVLGIKEVEE